MRVIILSNKHNGKYLFIEFGQYDDPIAIEIEEDDEINIWNS